MSTATPSSPDRGKLLERLRKLYAMSCDAGSPNEAAIALKRVTALMDQYDITIEEALSATPSDFDRVTDDGRYTRIPSWHRVCTYNVALLTGTAVRYVRANDGSKSWSATFLGFKQDVQVAAMTLDYILGAMERGCEAAVATEKFARRGRGRFSARSYSTAFRQSFQGALQGRILTMMRDRQEGATAGSLVIVKRNAVDDHFGLVGEAGTALVLHSRDRNGHVAGKEAGQRLSLNQQIGGSSAQQLE